MKFGTIVVGLVGLPAAAGVNFLRRGDANDPTKHRALDEIHCKPNTAGYGYCSIKPDPFCTPHRSPEYCPSSTSFSLLISKRTRKARNTPSDVTNDGHIFHLLEDKFRAYLFTTRVLNLKAPLLLHCEDSYTDALLGGGFVPAPGTGFVIRATNLHSGGGVFVLPTGFGGPELLSGIGSMTAADVFAALDAAGADKIIIEEFIEGTLGPNTLPTEYKMHVIGGKVVSINIVYNRGDNNACACWAEVDTQWNRLDKYGCFTPTGLIEEGVNIDSTDMCYDVDFENGRKRTYPMKGLDVCGPLPYKPCLDDLIAVAELVGNAVGAYVRVDMFLDANDVPVVQEYTSNHMGGTRHCSAKLSDDGTCVNACFLGELWNATGYPEYGGPPPPGSVVNSLESALSYSEVPPWEICQDMLGEELPYTGYANTCTRIIYTPISVATVEPSTSPTTDGYVSPTAAPSGSGYVPPTAAPSPTDEYVPPTVTPSIGGNVPYTGRPSNIAPPITYKQTAEPSASPTTDDYFPPTPVTAEPSTSPTNDEACSYRRQVISDFTLAEQQELANLVEQYLTVSVFAQHTAPGLHHTPAFLPWHRTYIGGLESFLSSPAINKTQYVPLPKWDPQNPIPPPFFVIDSSCAPCGTLPPPATGLPALPTELDGTNVCTSGYGDVEELRLGGGVSTPSLENWHDSIHVSIGGAFGFISTATHLLVFLLWHAFVDDIYWCYCQCGDCNSIPPPAATRVDRQPPNSENDALACLEETERMARVEVPSFGLENTALLATAEEAIATYTRRGGATRQRDLQLKNNVVNVTLNLLEDFRKQSSGLVYQEPFAAFLGQSFDQRIGVCKTLVEQDGTAASNTTSTSNLTARALSGPIFESATGTVVDNDTPIMTDANVGLVDTPVASE